MHKITIFLALAPTLEITESDIGDFTFDNIIFLLNKAMKDQTTVGFGPYHLNGRFIIGYEVK